MGDHIDDLYEDPLVVIDTPRKNGERARIVVENIWDQVEIAGRRMPRDFRVLFWRGTADRARATLDGRFLTQDDGIVCLQIGVLTNEHGPRIEAEDIRALRVDDMIDHAIEVLARPEYQTPERWLYYPGDRAGAQKDIKQARRKVNDALLRNVAEIYAANVGDAPTRAVEEHFGKSRRTASLWVKKAREAGYITETAR